MWYRTWYWFQNQYRVWYHLVRLGAIGAVAFTRAGANLANIPVKDPLLQAYK